MQRLGTHTNTNDSEIQVHNIKLEDTEKKRKKAPTEKRNYLFERILNESIQQQQKG